MEPVMRNVRKGKFGRGLYTDVLPLVRLVKTPLVLKKRKSLVNLLKIHTRLRKLK